MTSAKKLPDAPKPVVKSEAPAPAVSVTPAAAPVATPSAPTVSVSPSVAKSAWASTPVGVQLAFTDMLNALESAPGMQGYHGAGCMCGWCVRVQLAIVDARKIRHK